MQIYRNGCNPICHLATNRKMQKEFQSIPIKRRPHQSDSVINWDYAENNLHTIRMTENYLSLTFDIMIYRNKSYMQDKAFLSTALLAGNRAFLIYEVMIRRRPLSSSMEQWYIILHLYRSNQWDSIGLDTFTWKTTHTTSAMTENDFYLTFDDMIY